MKLLPAIYLASALGATPTQYKPPIVENLIIQQTPQKIQAKNLEPQLYVRAGEVFCTSSSESRAYIIYASI